MSTSAKLIFLCGKMAAGKTTLARDLARRENAVLLVEDAFLDSLFPGEITDMYFQPPSADEMFNVVHHERV